jgi:cytochrome c553
MRVLFLAAFGAFGVHMAAFAQAPATVLVGDAQAGQTKSSTCVACHGVDGNSVDPANAKIAGQHADYIAKHLQMFQNGERRNAVMSVQAANLSAQDMADLGAYFATQKVSAGNADEAVAAKGQSLYRGGAPGGLPSCMGCHGPSGRGNPAAKYPSLGGQHADYVKAQLQRFREGTAYGTSEGAKIMSQVANHLNDSDIEALSTYIEGLHTQ